MRQAEGVTIVVCPAAPGESHPFDFTRLESALLDSASAQGPGVLVIPAVDYEVEDDARTKRAHWVAAVAVAMSSGATASPIALVLIGTAGSLAPAVGFSQRAARRLVIGYILIDADLPRIDGAHDDWPDAPVVYVHSSQADPLNVNQARLRGWETVAIAAGDAATISSTVLEIFQTL